jgi:hypothetical protein
MDPKHAQDSMNADRRIPVPTGFPEGCTFAGSFSGDEFVRLPDGRIYKASDDGSWLLAAGGLPDRGFPMSEAGFLSTCAASRRFFESRQGTAKG